MLLSNEPLRANVHIRSTLHETRLNRPEATEMRKNAMVGDRPWLILRKRIGPPEKRASLDEIANIRPYRTFR